MCTYICGVPQLLLHRSVLKNKYGSNFDRRIRAILATDLECEKNADAAEDVLISTRGILVYDHARRIALRRLDEYTQRQHSKPNDKLLSTFLLMIGATPPSKHLLRHMYLGVDPAGRGKITASQFANFYGVPHHSLFLARVFARFERRFGYAGTPPTAEGELAFESWQVSE